MDLILIGLGDFYFNCNVFLFGCVFGIGLTKYFLDILKGKPAYLSSLFFALNSLPFFLNCLVLWIVLVVVTVIGFLCFIIPGIFFTIIFSQSLYLMVEVPAIGPFQAMKKSYSLMKGRECAFFCLFV